MAPVATATALTYLPTHAASTPGNAARVLRGSGKNKNDGKEIKSIIAAALETHLGEEREEISVHGSAAEDDGTILFR